MNQRSWLGYIFAAVALVGALVLAGTQTAHLSSQVPVQPTHYQIVKVDDPQKTILSAHYLNDYGQVAGGAIPYSSAKSNPISAGFNAKAALWDGQRLQIIPGTAASSIDGLNDAGQVLVGGRFLEAGGLIWSKRRATPIPRILPSAINNKGEVVGQLRARNAWRFTPCLWSRGKLTDISFGHLDIDPK
jgi:hypothetical protein